MEKFTLEKALNDLDYRIAEFKDANYRNQILTYKRVIFRLILNVIIGGS